MKGIIFNLFEDFVVSRYGDDKYQEIIVASDTGLLDPLEIVGPGSYPDEAFDAILRQTSEKIGRDIPGILQDMGRHSLPKLAARYPHFFEECEHPRDFLKTTSMIHHVEVKKLYQDAQVPHFFIENMSQEGLTLIYKSKRHLCHLCEGLIVGLGDYYKIPISINQVECTQLGDQECKFIIKFHATDKAARE